MKYIFAFLAIAVIGFGQLNAQEVSKKYVSIDLLNKSLKSIPLVIEGVMKPNLSPKSRSGVSCKVGTRIWTKGKRDLLLVVTEEMDGTSLEISGLISKLKRKKKGGH